MATGYGNDNFDRLRSAGLIRDDDCPEEIRGVIDGLSDDEMKVILSVKERLDEADRSRGARAAEPGELPEFTNCMVF
jgi:hypothetical protein